MDREKEVKKELIPEIPEAELMDYDNEKAQIIMYNKWDRIFDWFRRLAEKIDK